MAADLWAARNRAGVLGGIGAAQELGSVLGPMYGIALVWLFHHWQSVFWVNVPLAVIAMVMIHFSLPNKLKSEHPQKVDIAGGVLLAITLGLIVVGMYNPAPDGKQVLPSYGPPLLIGALVAAVAFFVWERFAKTRLIEPAGVHFRPFLAALGASLTAGAALMVTLVNVELFGQGVLGQDQNEAAFLLLRFLIALPIGALLGGWIATRIGDRAVACIGLLIAAGGYYLIAQWPVDLLAARHDLGFIQLPVAGYDLAIAGLGLGLVIGPRTSATLRVVPSAQHGIASAAVVVARMIGMLVWNRRPERVGAVPVQPDPAVAACEHGRQPGRQARSGSGEIQDRIRHAVRRDVRHHRDVCLSARFRVVDQRRHVHATNHLPAQAISKATNPPRR